MNNDKKRPLTKAVSSACDAFTRLYDRSIVCSAVHGVRQRFLTLSTRAIGVFFISFGIYSFLISMLASLFFNNDVSPSNIYGGVAAVLCALPLVFSKGNVSTILTGSAFGSIICDYLNIKRENLQSTAFSGHLSISFILGVLFGSATMLVPFSTILLLMGAAVMLCIILRTPEAGLTFMTVLLFFADEKIQYTLMGAMIFSYLFKLVRKKRKLQIKKTDVVFFIFVLCTAGALIFTTGDRSKTDTAVWLTLTLPYLMAVLLLRDGRKITKLLTVTVISAGTLCSLYVLGESIAALVPAGSVVDRDYLIRTISALPAFESGFAPLGISSLIPVCTAFIIKPKNEGSRFTLILCLASMCSYLFMAEEFMFIICAFISTAILLLITGSRFVYLTLAAIMSGIVTLVFAGSFGDRVYSYIYRNIYEAYHRAESIYALSDSSAPTEYLFCGQGFTVGGSGANFYYSLIAKLGIAGFVIFTLLILFIIIYATGLILKTYRKESTDRDLERFSAIVNRAETRMGVIAVVCSLLTVLIAATFFDFYKSELSYLALFLIMGVCSAYTRSTVGEIAKAEGSLVYQNTKERAFAAVSRQQNQGGIK